MLPLLFAHALAFGIVASGGVYERALVKVDDSGVWSLQGTGSLDLNIEVDGYMRANENGVTVASGRPQIKLQGTSQTNRWLITEGALTTEMLYQFYVEENGKLNVFGGIPVKLYPV